REPDEVGEAELRAGEIMPAGRGMLGGDAIGGDLDPVHLVGRDRFVVEQADERLDRGLDVPAAGIRLDVAVGDAERRRRRERNGARLVGVAEGEGLQEAVAPLDRIGRPLDPLLRQQRGLHALARGVSGMQALDIAAATTQQPGCTEPWRKPSSSSIPCAAVPARKAASRRSARRARPGTGMRPAGRTAASTASARLATSPPAPAIITPTVSSRWRWA